MPRFRPYIAQLRVAFTAPSDIHADHTADYLQARIEEHLDEGDTARVTQVVCVGEALAQEEVIARLRLARNDLIRLPYRDTMNLAQQVDMVIWKLMRCDEDDEAQSNDYDYNRVVEISHALARGENPQV